MSILDTWVRSDSATIAVDTGANNGEPVSKLLTLPHLPAVVAMRGSIPFLATVFHGCASRPFRSFDHLVQEFPAILEYVDATLPSFLRDSSFPDIELILVGWSDSRSRMMGRLFTKRSGEDFVSRDTEGCIAPHLPDIPTVPHALQEIARAQVSWMRLHQGIGGGRLLVARITREFLSVDHVMTFEEESTCLQ